MLHKAAEFSEKRKVPLLIFFAAFTIVYPYVFTTPFLIRMGTLILMNIMLALSLNLLTGMLGYISFGHAGFLGIGAYTAAILAKYYGIGSEITFIAAAVLAGAFGLLLGLTVLKLKGYHFAIVTMVFCEIMRAVELNWIDLTRGPMGITAIPKISFFGQRITSNVGIYYTILVLVVLTVIIITNLMNSRVGIAVLAIRDDDLVAATMGVNAFKYKVIVFVISSMLAGVSGAFYAQYITYIDPTNFSLLKSNEVLVLTIFGGLGNIVGSFLGAIVLTSLPELLRGLLDYRMLIYGAMLVFLMHVRPHGILGSINFKYIKQQRLQKQEIILAESEAKNSS